MSTRACIARAEGDGFRGVYHHSDGEPAALGRTLFGLARDRTLGGVGEMLQTLIDDHPAGWSTINRADWSQPAGFPRNGFRTTGPQCYCHGARNEGPQPVIQDDDLTLEWAYVFDADARTMGVCERVRPHGDGEESWVLREVVPLDGPEPDWRALGRR